METRTFQPTRVEKGAVRYVLRLRAVFGSRSAFWTHETAVRGAGRTPPVGEGEKITETNPPTGVGTRKFQGHTSTKKRKKVDIKKFKNKIDQHFKEKSRHQKTKNPDEKPRTQKKKNCQEIEVR